MKNTRTERINGFRCTPDFKKQAQELADRIASGNMSLLFEILVRERATGYRGGLHLEIPKGYKLFQADTDSYHLIPETDKMFHVKQSPT